MEIVFLTWMRSPVTLPRAFTVKTNHSDIGTTSNQPLDRNSPSGSKWSLKFLSTLKCHFSRHRGMAGAGGMSGLPDNEEDWGISQSHPSGHSGMRSWGWGQTPSIIAPLGNQDHTDGQIRQTDTSPGRQLVKQQQNAKARLEISALGQTRAN